MLRGNFSARIDDKGRLKIPAVFRAPIAEKYGQSLFVTSLKGESVEIYPLPVWIEIEKKVAAAPQSHPSRNRFLERVNYFGQPAEIDRQGRVSVHTRVRESAGMAGEVDVFGKYNYLEVWNHDRFLTRLEQNPFTEEDARKLAELGI